MKVFRTRSILWIAFLSVAALSLVACPVKLEKGISYASSWGLPITFGISTFLLSLRLRSANVDTLKPLAVFIVTFSSPWAIILTAFTSITGSLKSYYEFMGNNYLIMSFSWIFYLILSSYAIAFRPTSNRDFFPSLYMAISAGILSLLPISSMECLFCIIPAVLISAGWLGLVTDLKGINRMSHALDN